MDSSTAVFAVCVGVFAGLCVVFRRNLDAFSLIAAVVIVPLSHVSFMPRNIMNVPGISVANVVLITALISGLMKAGVPQTLKQLPRYFTTSFAVFLALFVIAVVRTTLDIDSLLPREGYRVPAALEVLFLDGVLAFKFTALGFLVALHSIRTRSTETVEKALLLVPIAVLPVVAAFFVVGVQNPVEHWTEYHAGRRMVSSNMGIHTNYLGRMAVYLLLFIVTARSLPWPRLRPLSILCSVALIEITFSRTAWLAAAILIVAALRHMSRRDLGWVAASVVVTSLALLPYLAERSGFGFKPTPQQIEKEHIQETPTPQQIEKEHVQETATPQQIEKEHVQETESARQEKPAQKAHQLRPETKQDDQPAPRSESAKTFHRVSAGRTGNIWPTALPIFYAHPILGQGLYSVWRPINTEVKRVAYNHPHNAYLEVALDMGLVGVAAVLWMMWGFWKLGGACLPFRYIIAGWLLVSITGGSFYPQLQNALNWVFLGLAVAMTALNSSRNSPEEKTPQTRLDA